MHRREELRERSAALTAILDPSATGQAQSQAALQIEAPSEMLKAEVASQGYNADLLDLSQKTQVAKGGRKADAIRRGEQPASTARAGAKANGSKEKEKEKAKVQAGVRPPALALQQPSLLLLGAQEVRAQAAELAVALGGLSPHRLAALLASSPGLVAEVFAPSPTPGPTLSSTLSSTPGAAAEAPRGATPAAAGPAAATSAAAVTAAGAAAAAGGVAAEAAAAGAKVAAGAEGAAAAAGPGRVALQVAAIARVLGDVPPKLVSELLLREPRCGRGCGDGEVVHVGTWVWGGVREPRYGHGCGGRKGVQVRV